MLLEHTRASVTTSTARIRNVVPVPYGIALAAVLLVTLAYAVLLRQIELWLWGVVAVASLALLSFVVYLFYRLVLAVERIADES